MSVPPIPPQPPVLQYAASKADPKLLRIALAQRRVMWIILSTFLLLLSFAVGTVITPSGGAGQIIAIGLLTLIRLGITVMMMIGIYRLSSAPGNATSTSVLYVIGMLIPCINLVILLVVNQQATKILTYHRVKVGLMGARLSDIPAAYH